MSPAVGAAVTYLLRYGPKAWRRLRVWNRSRGRTVRSFLAAAAEVIGAVDDPLVADDGATRRIIVWEILEASWPDVVAELSPSERNLVNELLLNAVRRAGDVEP